MKSVCEKHQQAFEIECPYCETVIPAAPGDDAGIVSTAEWSALMNDLGAQQQGSFGLGLHAIAQQAQGLGGISNVIGCGTQMQKRIGYTGSAAADGGIRWRCEERDTLGAQCQLPANHASQHSTTQAWYE